MTPPEDPGARLYLVFAEIFNARDYERLDEVLTADFTDHHPGLVDVAGLAEYRRNLAAVVQALDMRAEPRDVASAGDMVYTRVKLTGRHVGTFLGLESTDNGLSWYTHEIWRIHGNRFCERWAVDDLHGLLGQMGYPLPSWTDPA
jgi:predicted ester cyclase